jgi:hypothetical protein
MTSHCRSRAVFEIPCFQFSVENAQMNEYADMVNDELPSDPGDQQIPHMT